MASSGVLARFFGANTIILLCGIGSGILLARFLAPEGRGVLAGILFWPHFLTGVLNFGVNEAITLQKPSGQKGQSTVFWLTTAIACLVIPVVALALPWFLSDEIARYHTFIVLYFVFFFFASSLSLNLTALDLGLKKHGRYNLVRILQAAFYPAFIIILWASGFLSVTNAALAALASTCLPALYRLSLVFRSVFVRPDVGLIQAIYQSGIKLHFTNFVIFMTAEIDKMLLIRLGTATELGLYVVSLTFATASQGVVVKGFTDIILSRAKAQSIDDVFENSDIHIIQLGFLLTATLATVLVVAMPILMLVLVGQEYRDAVVVCQVLILAYMFSGLRRMLIYTLRSKFENLLSGKVEILVLMVMAILFYPCYQAGGALGVASAVLLGNFFGLVSLLFFISRKYSLSTMDWLRVNLSAELRYARKIASSWIGPKS